MPEIIKHLAGKCQERAGIPANCRIVYNTDIKPQIGDIVVCSDKYGSLTLQIKLLIGFEGKRGWVSTQFFNSKRDFTFLTPRIFGVVVKCLASDSDTVIWERAPTKSEAAN